MSINYLKSILATGKVKLAIYTDIENKSVNDELISMLTDQLPLAFLENDLIFPSEVLSIINVKDDDEFDDDEEFDDEDFDDEDFDDEDFDDEEFDDSDFYDDEFDDDFEDDFEEEPEEDSWDDSF